MTTGDSDFSNPIGTDLAVSWDAVKSARERSEADDDAKNSSEAVSEVVNLLSDFHITPTNSFATGGLLAVVVIAIRTVRID